jgi:hypothetical protein
MEQNGGFLIHSLPPKRSARPPFAPQNIVVFASKKPLHFRPFLILFWCRK